MGKIVFETPPDLKRQYQHEDPYRLQVIQDTTHDFSKNIKQAIREITDKEQGKDTVSKALQNAKDHTIYIYADPMMRISTTAIQTNGGYYTITIQPCDGFSEFLDKDGEYHRFKLSRILAHEFAHIAQNHINGGLKAIFTAKETKETKETKENSAIRIENDIATEHSPNANQRIDDDYEKSGRAPEFITQECRPSTFKAGF